MGNEAQHGESYGLKILVEILKEYRWKGVVA
jgi:hypothetical protein